MATSNSVRSASSTEGGGSLACRIGTSFLKRRILHGGKTGRRWDEMRRRATKSENRSFIVGWSELSGVLFGNVEHLLLLL